MWVYLENNRNAAREPGIFMLGGAMIAKETIA